MKKQLLDQEQQVRTEVKTLDVKTSDVKRHKKRYGYRISKRMCDFILALIGLVICIVPIAIIALIIKIDSKGPVFYIHRRVGQNGKELPLLKFRSMHINASEMIKDFTPEQKAEWESNFKLKNDPRITKVGKFLRRSSIDELPQLINILKGDLSFVGPRPIVEEELQKYGENRDLFLSAKPGLTGYWQAYARSTCTYEQRVKMELFYVENATLWLDIKIMFATFAAVLRGRGAE